MIQVAIGEAAVVRAGPRHAALLLHGLPDADRAWLLEHLETEQQAALQPLLEDLAALGLPVTCDVVQQLLGTPRTAAPPGASCDAAAELITALHAVPHSTLKRLMRGAPDVIVRTVLSHAAARQRRAVLRAFDSARRIALLASTKLERTTPWSRRDAVILQVLLEQAGELGTAVRPGRVPTGSRRLAGAIARLRARHTQNPTGDIA